MDAAQTKPQYVAGKVAGGKWGVFFRLDETTSFGPKGQTFKTRREAQREASDWNWAAAQEAKEVRA